MEKQPFLFPIPDMQKKFVLSGFSTLSILLKFSDNPFTLALSECIDKQLGFKLFNDLIDKCNAQNEGANWILEHSEVINLFIMLDLTTRIYKAGYYVHLAAFIKEHTGKEIYPFEHLERGQSQTLEMVEDARNYLDYLTQIESVAALLWHADRFPDPVTGMSPLEAAYGHMPKLPKDPPTMSFSNYGDEIEFVYDTKKNPASSFKDYRCMGGLLMLLSDIDNPPARIITTYFPTIIEELINLSRKFMTKTKGRRRRVNLTQGDFGLIYACNDIFGRLYASSYYNLLPELQKSKPEFKTLTPLNEEGNALNMSFTTSIVDRDLKRFNRDYGDYPVIRDYRKIAAVMIGFDD